MLFVFTVSQAWNSREFSIIFGLLENVHQLSHDKTLETTKW